MYLVVASDYARQNNRSYYGGAVAAPGATAAIERILTYYQVPASPELPAPPPHIADVLWKFKPGVYKRKTPLETAAAGARN